MSFRSLVWLRRGALLAALLIASACTDDRAVPLSLVETIDIPVADAGPQANQNISNPTLEIPETFEVSDGDQLTLVWSEEFDGPNLDPEVWFFATGDGTEKGLPGGWGNRELQYYLPDNAMVVNGVLEITARRETVGEFSYTSARINTEDRFAFKYGRIEASIKLPAGQGIWPAFWMLSQDSPYGSWAATGEIDIMEAVNLGGTGGNEIYGTLHYGGEAPANTFTGETYTPSVDVTADFHTYALEWDQFEFRWYFDGLLYAVQNSWSSAAAPYPAPFDQPFHILLNVAVGGNFPGSPNGTTTFPVTMGVDWVRVYSGEEAAPEPADPGTVPEVVVYASDPGVTVDLPPPAGIQDFGSGATFNTAFLADADFSPALQVSSGTDFGVDVGFAAFPGYPGGFAAGYETFSFKVKGLPANVIEVKFFDPFSGDGNPPNEVAVNYDVTTYGGSTALGNGWYEVNIPLSDFSAFIDINEGFLLGPPGDQGAPFTFLLTDIGFNSSAGGGGTGGAGGELAVNGDFESGDLTGWTTFENGGSIAVSSPGSTGTYAINVNASGGAFNPTVKQANLGAGQLTAGQQVTVSFDWKGTAGVGGVVDVVLFSEAGGGGASQTDQILSGGAFPADWTTVGPLAINIGPDVGAGVTLQFTAICGGDATCDSNLFLDNISIIADGGGTGGGGTGGGGNTGSGTALATFDEVPAPAVTAFGGAVSVIETGPAGGDGSNALKILRDGGDVFAGAWVAIPAIPSNAGTQTVSALVYSPTAGIPMVAKAEFGENAGSGDVQANETVVSGWQTLTWTFTNLDSAQVYNRFVMLPNLGTIDTATNYFFDNITLVGGGSGSGGGGGGGGSPGDCGASTGGGTGGAAGMQLAINGDFETGDLNGWTAFQNGGTISICSPGSSGAFAGKLVASGGPFNPTLKQANVGAGQLTPGQAVTVSFDWKGVVAAGDPIGAVFDARLFSELDGGGISQENIILSIADAFPANWTTVGPQTFNIGTDVSGGVTLQFNAACGGAAACVSEVVIDNVSITTP